MWFHRWWRCAGVGAGFALAAGLAAAWGAGPPVGPATGRPVTGAREMDIEPQVRSPVRRVAAAFDFEEEDNPYPVPRHWVRAQDSEKLPRPGYPGFNLGEFDFSV